MQAGCSEIIPGLNIRMGGGAHEYKIVGDEEKGGYDVAKASSLPAYEIIPVGPEVLKALAHEPEDGFTYSLPSVLPSDVPPEYQVGPSDIVYVTVWEHPELSTPAGPILDIASSATSAASLVGAAPTVSQYVQGRLVAADGTLFFPYVGVIKVAGMTVADLRQRIATGLQGVIIKPQVDVRVIAFRSARVEVTGEVAKPGTVGLDDTPKGIIQVINLSGGLTGTASRRRAILIRQGHTYNLDLAGLLSGDRPVGNPLLMPGDVLHIPDQSGDQVFVLGAVDKQTPVPMQQASLSLVQALTVAGGFDTARGKQTGVLVFRVHQSHSQAVASVYTLDFSKPEGILLASQFDLQPRDVVYVPATAFSQYNSVISQLLPTVSTIYELNQLNVVP